MPPPTLNSEEPVRETGVSMRVHKEFVIILQTSMEITISISQFVSRAMLSLSIWMQLYCRF